MNKINRRTLLKYAGTGMAAGILSGSLGKAMTSAIPDNMNQSTAGVFPEKSPFH